MTGDGTQTPKKWWKSKTIWFNVLGAALAVAGAAPGLIPVSPDVLVGFVAAGNVVLRTMTGQPIGK